MATYTESISHLSPVWTHYTPIVASRAEGCYIYDQDGTAYLDFTCGIGVTNTGHCHPHVVEAIRKQAGLLLHGQANIVMHEPMLELVHERARSSTYTGQLLLHQLGGGRPLKGRAETARHATSRTNIHRLPGQLHGRTISTISTDFQDDLPRRLPTVDAGGVRRSYPLRLPLRLG
jgi:4-aminobutyrate aminotransferase